jgi:hypothetical protein
MPIPLTRTGSAEARPPSALDAPPDQPPTATGETFAFTIAPRRPVLLLGLGAVLLGAAGFAVSLSRSVYSADLPHVLQRLGLNAENSVPAWYSGSLLLLCALALWGVARSTRASGGRYVLHWRVLAAAFAYLSLDEIASLHELANAPVRDALDLSGALYLSWVVVAVPLVVGFGLAYVRFLLHLPARTRWLFVAAAAVFLTGAVGLELPGSVLYEQGETISPAYAAVSALEETMEMLGTVLFLYAVTSYRPRSRPAATAAAG